MEKLRGMEPSKPLRFLQKIEKPIPRPPTPAVQVPDEVCHWTGLCVCVGGGGRGEEGGGLDGGQGCRWRGEGLTGGRRGGSGKKGLMHDRNFHVIWDAAVYE